MDFNFCTDNNDQPRDKRRKIDKDGFVCPSTPDIPGHNHSHAESEELAMTDGYTNIGQFEETDNSVESQSHYFPEVSPPDQSQALGDQDPNEGGAASQMHPRTEEAVSTNSIIKGFQEELKLLLGQWGGIFRSSEEFEYQCPNKLDLLISEAKNLEESLNSQKNILCQRLTGISETLKL